MTSTYRNRFSLFFLPTRVIIKLKKTTSRNYALTRSLVSCIHADELSALPPCRRFARAAAFSLAQTSKRAASTCKVFPWINFEIPTPRVLNSSNRALRTPWFCQQLREQGGGSWRIWLARNRAVINLLESYIMPSSSRTLSQKWWKIVLITKSSRFISSHADES